MTVIPVQWQNKKIEEGEKGSLIFQKLSLSVEAEFSPEYESDDKLKMCNLLSLSGGKKDHNKRYKCNDVSDRFKQKLSGRISMVKCQKIKSLLETLKEKTKSQQKGKDFYMASTSTSDAKSSSNESGGEQTTQGHTEVSQINHIHS